MASVSIRTRVFSSFQFILANFSLLQNLVQVINDMGNPFLEDTAELLMLDTRDFLHESVVTTVCTVEKLGMDRYEDYYKAVIKNRKTSIHEPIKTNSLSLFRCPVSKSKSKQAGQNTMLNNNVVACILSCCIGRVT